MQDIVIAANSLSKKYRINELADMSYNGGVSLNAQAGEFWALNNLNFEIKRGEVVGFIGKNGAGKSTLLKILSGVTKPTGGSVMLKGTVCSMLEVGTGFSPDLTGRENVFMNGLLLGMTERAIEKKLNSIIDYSGIAKFIDTQVKHYSSGMYIRLAFSILTNLETDIILLDEVLSVGDADFKIKSFDTLKELAQSGRTVLLASHNAQELEALCTRIIWLEDSTIRYDASATKAIEQYLLATYQKQDIEGGFDGHTGNGVDAINVEDTSARSLAGMDESEMKENIDLPEKTKQRVWPDAAIAPGNEKVKLLEIGLKATGKGYDEPIFMEDEMDVTIVFEKLNDEKTTDITLEVFNITGVHVFTDSMTLRYQEFGHIMPKGVYTLRTKIPGNLLNRGVYFITLAATANMREMIDVFQRILYFRITQNVFLITSKQMQEIYDMNEFISCVVKPQLQWQLFNNEEHRVL